MPGGGLRPPRTGYGSPLLHADCMAPPCQPLFPGWEIEAKWTAAASGPDGRYLLARQVVSAHGQGTGVALAAFASRG